VTYTALGRADRSQFHASTTSKPLASFQVFSHRAARERLYPASAQGCLAGLPPPVPTPCLRPRHARGSMMSAGKIHATVRSFKLPSVERETWNTRRLPADRQEMALGAICTASASMGWRQAPRCGTSAFLFRVPRRASLAACAGSGFQISWHVIHLLAAAPPSSGEGGSHLDLRAAGC